MQHGGGFLISKGRTAIALVALAAAVLAVSAGPAGEDAVTLTVQAYDAGEAEYWFEVEGLEGRNPAITLPPGAHVVVTLRNHGHLYHNVHFEAVHEATHQIGPGQGAVLEFTVPEDASGESEYFCDPHRELGMRGELRFDETPEEAGRGIPGPGPVAALTLLAAAALRQKQNSSTAHPWMTR